MGFMQRARQARHEDAVGVMLATAAGGNPERALDMAWAVVRGMSDGKELAEFVCRMARVGSSAFLEWRGVPFRVVDHDSPHVMFARRMVGYAGGDVPDAEMMGVLWNVAREAGLAVQAESLDVLLRLVLQIVARQEDRS